MQTITLQNDNQYIGIDKQGLISIKTGCVIEHYNPKYFKINQQCASVSVDDELKLLTNIGYVINKFKRLDKQIIKTSITKDKDELILLNRQIVKNKSIINKYLNYLKDSHIFNITKDENKIILELKGQYVTAKKTASINNKIEGVNL
jgi:hypothetical protein